MITADHKIPLGISSCLLGHEVRYDGGHKYNAYIAQTLGKHFQFISFCPELESGMGVPRPPVQLRRTEKGIRCVAVKDHSVDVTEQLQCCSQKQNQWLQQICGFILKKGSPSCGMECVPVHDNDAADPSGMGVFVQYIKDRFPLLPLAEEGRLGDPILRENFILRVYMMQRWQQLHQQTVTPQRLTVFHSQHKLIAMSHDQNDARKLGRLAATADKDNIIDVTDRYGSCLMQCLGKIATRGNHVNVLQHIQGYLKNSLDADDKSELSQLIERYRLGQLPLIAPVTLLQHHFRKQADAFIDNSFYMSLYGGSLALND